MLQSDSVREQKERDASHVKYKAKMLSVAYVCDDET